MLIAEPLLAKALVVLLAVLLAPAAGLVLSPRLRALAPPALAERLAAGFARRFDRPGRSPASLAWRGGVVCVLLGLTGFGLGAMAERAASFHPQAWMLLPALLAACLSPLGPIGHGRRVLRLLEERAAVDAAERRILPAQTIEQTAAALNGGLIAPLFWYALLGLPGVGAYTALAAVERAAGERGGSAFAEAPQQVAVLMKWLPGWITGLMLLAASLFVPQCSPGRALRSLFGAIRRPGWIVANPAIAIVAGAIQAELANHRSSVARGWNFAVGVASNPASGAHLRRALALYGIAAIQAVTLFLAAVHLAARAS